MRKEEHPIALLESHANGRMDRKQLREALNDFESFSDPDEAVNLYHASVEAIEFSALRKEIEQICKEEKAD